MAALIKIFCLAGRSALIRNRTWYMLLLLFCCLSFSYQAKATHAAGGELIYQWISDSTYKITFKFYRDCAGVAAPSAVTACCTNKCDTTSVFFASLLPIVSLPDGRPNGSPVNPGCPQYPTTCNGGALNGYAEWWYEGTITLPYRCNNWRFAIDIQSRNNAVNNIVPNNVFPFPANYSLYLEATLNNVLAQGASSPYFMTKPVPYVCLNEPYSYNSGTIDPDGDSLSFEMIQPQTDNGICPYLSAPMLFNTAIPYNLNDNPLACNNTFQLNARTGQMNFTPAIQQVAVLTMRTNKYRNGVLIGSIMRDVEVIVITCNNPAPTVSVPLSVVNGDYTNGILHTCAGNALQFCMQFISPDTGAVLVVRDNANPAIQGANVTYSGLITDSVRSCINWTPTALQEGLHVLVYTVVDSQCKPPGILVTRSFSVPVYVYPTLRGGNDTTICLGDAAQLNAKGGSSFKWSVLSGDISSLSCTNCSNPVTRPVTTTSYLVKNNYFDTTVCKTSDTVVVYVRTGPGTSIDTAVTKCHNDTAQLILQVNPNTGGYSFQWYPANFLSSDTAQQPFSWAPVSTKYTVKVLQPGNVCPSYDTVQLFVPAAPSFIADSIACIGELLRFNNTSSPGLNTWLWQFGNGSSSTLKNPAYAYPAPGTYHVSLVGYPCADTAYRQIIVDTPSYVRFTTDTKAVCIGTPIHFYPAHTGGADSLLWTFGDGSGGLGATVEHAYDVPGIMQVTLTAKYRACPEASFSDTMQAYPFPVVNIGADTAVCPGQFPVVLTNHATNIFPLVNHWSTGATAPAITINQAGSYWLTADAGHGCTTTDTILVSDNCYADIPNAFSPNGDGNHDYFFPRALLTSGADAFHMSIFNRWGQLIFETSNMDGRGWDGKMNGVDQPQGVYIYQLEIHFINATKKTHRGNVTLLR